MPRAEASERFWIVVRRALERADREDAAHLARIRALPSPEPDEAGRRAHQTLREAIFAPRGAWRRRR